MLQRVREIIADVTKNPVAAVREDSSHENLDGWDSVAQINILVTVESEFGLMFSPEEFQSLNSFRKIMEAVQSTSAKAGLV